MNSRVRVANTLACPRTRAFVKCIIYDNLCTMCVWSHFTGCPNITVFTLGSAGGTTLGVLELVLLGEKPTAVFARQ